MKRLPVLSFAAMVVIGCSQPATKSSPDNDKPAQKDDGQASPLGLLGSLMSARANGPGPYDALTESAGFSASANHLAIVELSGPVVERASFSLLGGNSGTELFDVTQRFTELAADPHVTGLLLRVGELSMDITMGEELRESIERFKASGPTGHRSVTCHATTAAQAAYYVLTACDKLALAPTGMVQIPGPAAMPVHVKGLMDKLGIRADFVHIGAYKGAAEPLTRDAPSPEMRETLQAILDESYSVLAAGIAGGRGLADADARARIDRALFQGQEAVSAGLVDEIATFGAFRDEVAKGQPWNVVPISEEQPTDLSALMEMLGMEPKERSADPHVAVVYAVGSVVDGDGGGIPGARKHIASRTLSTTILALARASSVKAIVLRINSGGGSALASEIIWHAIDTAKKSKPVIVSMGRVAASGGYYIASGATKIYALNTTLTGSIGVIGGKIVFDKAPAKLGVGVFPMGVGKRALLWSPVRMWTASEREAVRKLMAGVYDTFVGRVAAGRHLDRTAVLEIAQGRVWTGRAAKKNGLVDEIGGLDAAIAEARKLAKVGVDVPLEVYPPKPTLLDLLQSFGDGGPFGAATSIAAIAGRLGPEWARVASELLAGAAMARQSHVMTATFLPTALVQ